MPYEDDPRVLDWFERALTDDRPRVRRAAVELLEYVDCHARDRWLERAQSDPEARVAATSAIVEAIVAHRRESTRLELLESDLATGMDDSLDWEWEYSVRVCRGMWVPPSVVLVWMHAEDDRAARRIALMKAVPLPGGSDQEDATPVITHKSLVNQYTRSARSMAEAMLWHQKGRPRYSE